MLNFMRLLSNKKKDATLKSKTLRNLFWLTTSTLLTMSLNMSINFFLARKMGAATYGQWSLILAVTAWIVVLRTAVGSDLVRKSAQDSQYGRSVFVPTVLLLITGGAVIGGIGMLLNWTIIQTKDIFAPSIITALAFVVIALSSIPVSIFIGRDRMQWQLGDSVNSLLILIFLVLLILFGHEVTISTVANLYLNSSLIITVPLILGGILLIKPVSLWWPESFIRSSFIDIGQLFIVNWQLTLHWTIELYLLQILLGSRDVGLYNAAFKLIAVFRILPSVLMMSLVPEVARRAAISDFVFIRETWETSTRILLSAAGLLIPIILVFADDIVLLVYSSEYERSTIVFMILSASLFPFFMQSVIQSLIYAMGHYQKLNWGLAAGLLVQALAGYVLIFNFSLEGAAISFIIGECTILAFFYFFAVGIFGRPSTAFIGNIVISSLVTMAFTILGLQYRIPSILLFGAVIIAYCLLLYFLRCISVHDIQIVKSLLIGIRRRN